MIALNEEKCLRRCLESVKNLVNEIIIVDTGSTDSTKQIALEYGAMVYDFVWTNNFSDARNFALMKSTGDWNLVLDADEYISNDCFVTLKEFINTKHAIGRVKIVNAFMEQETLSYSQSITSRVFPKGLYYKGKIHEQIETDLPRVILPVEVQHDGYIRGSRSERNIPLLELEIVNNPNNPYYYFQIAREFKGMGCIDLALQNFAKAYSLLTKKENYAPNAVVDYLYCIMSGGNLVEGLSIIEVEDSYLRKFPDFHFLKGVYYLETMISDPTTYMYLLPQIEQAYKACIELGETKEYDSVIGTGSFAAYYNLGVFYEVTGQSEKALNCYRKSAGYNYHPAKLRVPQSE
ncbi:glycosyltransferase [Paenibacillus sp. MAH-34]|uniref:Glycosyltransferase n=2 Tax=Paenibacillus TaxID=44249 RepID=A0ABW9U804_9BACL|nr:glycosyltransferase family 2 protein [Paenibacillus anseongense]MVQ34480.1 glycosyltransferase [Paenibacillus anseongense]